MAFGIIAYHQFGNLRRQLLRIRHPYLFGHTVRSHTHIATHHVFEADKDLELLEAFLAIQVLLGIGADTPYRKVQPASVDGFRDRGNFDAEHHPLVINRLVCIRKLVYRLVDGFGSPALDDMAHPDFGIVYRISSEHPLRTLPHGFDELVMGDGHLGVIGAYRGNTVVLEVVKADLFGIGLDERLAWLFFGSFPKRGFFILTERGRGNNRLHIVLRIFNGHKGQRVGLVIGLYCPPDSCFHSLLG